MQQNATRFSYDMDENDNIREQQANAWKPGLSYRTSSIPQQENQSTEHTTTQFWLQLSKSTTHHHHIKIEQRGHDPSYTYIASKNTRPADPATAHQAVSEHPNTTTTKTQTHPQAPRPGPAHTRQERTLNTIYGFCSNQQSNIGAVECVSWPQVVLTSCRSWIRGTPTGLWWGWARRWCPGRSAWSSCFVATSFSSPVFLAAWNPGPGIICTPLKILDNTWCFRHPTEA